DDSSGTTGQCVGEDAAARPEVIYDVGRADLRAGNQPKHQCAIAQEVLSAPKGRFIVSWHDGPPSDSRVRKSRVAKPRGWSGTHAEGDYTSRALEERQDEQEMPRGAPLSLAEKRCPQHDPTHIPIRKRIERRFRSSSSLSGIVTPC